MIAGSMYIIIFAWGFGGTLRVPSHDSANIDAAITTGMMYSGSCCEMSDIHQNDTPRNSIVF
ncbi:hypothetical protein D3C83_155870 [compost metagenome]